MLSSRLQQTEWGLRQGERQGQGIAKACGVFLARWLHALGVRLWFISRTRLGLGLGLQVRLPFFRTFRRPWSLCGKS